MVRGGEGNGDRRENWILLPTSPSQPRTNFLNSSPHQPKTKKKKEKNNNAFDFKGFVVFFCISIFQVSPYTRMNISKHSREIVYQIIFRIEFKAGWKDRGHQAPEWGRSHQKDKVQKGEGLVLGQINRPVLRTV